MGRRGRSSKMELGTLAEKADQTHQPGKEPGEIAQILAPRTGGCLARTSASRPLVGRRVQRSVGCS